MSISYLWHLWPGRHWPSSLAEEAAVLADLQTRAPRPSTQFERSDTTAILNILRLGLTFDEVLAYAPGLKANRLLGAYQDLEQRRAHSSAALLEILDDPTLAAITHLAEPAALLAPVPTYRVVTAVRAFDANPSKETANRVEVVVETIERLIEEASTEALAFEALLDELTHQERTDEVASRAVALGRTLYDPYDECVWGHQFYLPRRLTDLLPSRVSDLLGESEV